MENMKERYDELAKLDFTTRESYFVWVRKWKAFYKELSQYIREVKAMIRAEHKEMSGGPETANDDIPMWKLRAWVDDARIFATCALQLRATGKKESWAAKMRALETVS